MASTSSLSAYRTKTDIILDALRQRVMSGELAPGQRLVLRAIADEFSCSDIPVREAMRALAAEGMVSIAPHEGARVTALQAGELIELTETRALLEPAATVSAGAVIEPAAIERLVAMVKAMRAVADGISNADYGRLNRKFHRTILAACPNRTLVQLIEDLWSKAERGRVVHRIFDGHMEVSMQHHEEILRCLKARDLVALRVIAEAHSAHGLAAVKRLAVEDELPVQPPRRLARRKA
jgi:DNA-binding GntR family transcriptional regulator